METPSSKDSPSRCLTGHFQVVLPQLSLSVRSVTPPCSMLTTPGGLPPYSPKSINLRVYFFFRPSRTSEDTPTLFYFLPFKSGRLQYSLRDLTVSSSQINSLFVAPPNARTTNFPSGFNPMVN